MHNLFRDFKDNFMKYNHKVVDTIYKILSNGIWIDPEKLFEFETYEEMFLNNQPKGDKFYMLEKLVLKLMIKHLSESSKKFYVKHLQIIHYNCCRKMNTKPLYKEIFSRKIYQEIINKNPKIDTL